MGVRDHLIDGVSNFTSRLSRLVDPDGLWVGMAVEAAPLQEQVAPPDVLEVEAESPALRQRQRAHVHRLEGELHLLPEKL